MSTLLIKAGIGAALALIVHVVSRGSHFYLAGMVVLFPIWSVLAHYSVGTVRDTDDLKQTILFGVCSLIPFLAYLLTMFLVVDRMKLLTAILISLGVWLVFASALTIYWNR